MTLNPVCPFPEIVQYLVYNPDNGIQTVSLDTEFLTPIKEPPNMAFKVRTFDIDARYWALCNSLSGSTYNNIIRCMQSK